MLLSSQGSWFVSKCSLLLSGLSLHSWVLNLLTRLGLEWTSVFWGPSWLPGTLPCHVLPGGGIRVWVGNCWEICWCFCSKMSGEFVGCPALHCILFPAESCDAEGTVYFSNCNAPKALEWLLFSMCGSQHNCPYWLLVASVWADYTFFSWREANTCFSTDLLPSEFDQFLQEEVSHSWPKHSFVLTYPIGIGILLMFCWAEEGSGLKGERGRTTSQFCLSGQPLLSSHTVSGPSAEICTLPTVSFESALPRRALLKACAVCQGDSC